MSDAPRLLMSHAFYYLGVFGDFLIYRLHIGFGGRLYQWAMGKSYDWDTDGKVWKDVVDHE